MEWMWWAARRPTADVSTEKEFERSIGVVLKRDDEEVSAV